MELIAKNDSMIEYATNYWKKDSYKDEIENVCDSLGIDSEGNKEKLLERIHDYLFKKESRKNVQKEFVEKKYQIKTESAKNIDGISEEDLHNNFRDYDPFSNGKTCWKIISKKRISY